MSDPSERDLQRAEETAAYVQGTMPADQRIVFEERVRTDMALRNDVQAERLMGRAAPLEHVVEFRKLLAEVAECVERLERLRPDESGGKVAEFVVVPEAKVIPIDRRQNWGWIAAAAGVAMIATFGIARWMDGPDASDLAMQYAKGSLPTKRSNGASESYSGVLELDSALNLLIANKPDQAQALLGSYSPRESELSCKRDWLMALAELQQEHEAEAVKLMEKVISARCYPEEASARELKAEL